MLSWSFNGTCTGNWVARHSSTCAHPKICIFTTHKSRYLPINQLILYTPLCRPLTLFTLSNIFSFKIALYFVPFTAKLINDLVMALFVLVCFNGGSGNGLTYSNVCLWWETRWQREISGRTTITSFQLDNVYQLYHAPKPIIFRFIACLYTVCYQWDTLNVNM